MDFRVAGQIVFLDHLQSRVGGHAGHGIAPKGRDREGLERISNLWSGDCHAQGHAVGHSLGHGHYIGFHTPVLDAEHLSARATKACLHLVANENPAVLADDLGCDGKVLRRGHHKAAHTQDGLGQKARDLARGGGLDQFFDVGGAGHFAGGIGQFEGTAIAVGRGSVLDTGNL